VYRLATPRWEGALAARAGGQAVRTLVHAVELVARRVQLRVTIGAPVRLDDGARLLADSVTAAANTLLSSK
jgi:hypothetical protein